MTGGGPGRGDRGDEEADHGGIFRLRDIPMGPRRGIFGAVQWMHFEATVQLRIPLRGAEWSGLVAEAFHVKVSKRGLIAKCKCFYVMEELDLCFRHDIDPSACWLDLERELGDATGRTKVLLLQLAKRTPGEAWSRRWLSSPKPARSPEELRILFESEQEGWRSLRPRPWRADEDDEAVTNRERLCRDLEIGQTEESVQLRMQLDASEWKQATARVPHHQLWGLDISRRHVKLFVRGDPHHPVILCKLAGNCAPDRCYLQLSTVLLREGDSEEDVPCLDLLIVKADDSYFDWGQDPVDFDVSDDVLDEKGFDSDPGLDLEGQSTGEWIQLARDRATVHFKAGEYSEAVVLYSRVMQCTPASEKMLTNRSVAFLKLGKFHLSLADALKAEQICPHFAKVYFRKGQALQGLHRLKEAIAAFRQGMALDSEENPEWQREILRTKHMQRDVREKKGTWI